MVDFDLKDKVVLVTGASSGIGRACAVAFHQSGSRLVVVARSGDKLDELAALLGGERCLAVAGDVTIEDDRRRILERARDRFDSIDVLINNAGWASFGTVARLPQEHLDRMVALNFLAPIALIQAVLGDMLERGSGQIINVASVVGIQAIPRMTVYSATKAALSALSTGLRMELRGTGVDVLLVSPGSTRTPFFESAGVIDARATRLAGTKYTAERVARAVVRSSRTRRAEVTLTLEGWSIGVIRRFSHRLADAIMVRVARRAMPLIALDRSDAAGND